jgi:hypothetical protein
MKAKLSLGQLSAYLPYKVKARFKIVNVTNCRSYVIGTVSEISDNGKITCYDTVNSWPDKFKLLLRPMSALDEKALSEMNYDTVDQLWMTDLRDRHVGYWNVPYNVVQILLKYHYDIFGLIEKGLAEPIKD